MENHTPEHLRMGAETGITEEDDMAMHGQSSPDLTHNQYQDGTTTRENEFRTEAAQTTALDTEGDHSERMPVADQEDDEELDRIPQKIAA